MAVFIVDVFMPLNGLAKVNRIR